MASCPDSDNSWVLAGSESLPVETLGPEPTMDPKPQRAPQGPGSPAKADEELAGTLDGEETLFQSETSQSGPILPEETEAKGVLEGDGPGLELPDSGDIVAQGDLEEAPVVADLGPDTQDLEDQSPQQSLPSSTKAAWIREAARCTSSEDDTDVDVEGLRRRRGREPSTPRPTVPLGAEDQAGGEAVSGELGISLNMCLLGALVLLGLGILLFSGGLSESESEPMEEVELQVFPDATLDNEMADAVGDGQDGLRQQLQASAAPDSVPSLQSMALLLDKLAKENQDIRLLQAQLQAQKEELQSLMHQPKGLEEENAQLRGALQHGQASQRALELELQQLRARLQGLEADCIRGTDGVCLGWGRGPQDGKVSKEQGPQGQEPGTGFLKQREQLEAEAQALRQELERQQRLLGSVQRDLEQSLRNAGQGDPAHAGLAELGHRLAPVQQQELASLLRTYLARLPWAGQLTTELPLSPAYFGEDGIFRHDRLRFRDFVDALEDSLEEVAVRQTGDDDEVDDFEDFIFSHFFGDKALRKRSGKKDRHFGSPRVVGPREEHSPHRRG
uniref:PBX homeobox interacting protein 1 n=1 Tax=Molossus molossus TaxID=27622 RepID=A0A7J8CSS3_MOLMO|nr:PBX homeobox interacting protein 1 [Molossus molossus]